jgi:hypothetical protein
MESPDEIFGGENLEALCKKLLAGGWLAEYAVSDNGGVVHIKWTAKGLEQATLLNGIGETLQLTPNAFRAVAVLCYMNAPHQ